MVAVWATSFVFVFFVCVDSLQPIYLNEKNDCVCNDQTIQTLNKKIDSIRKENARHIDSLKRENTRIIVSQKKIQEEFDEIVNILKKNETNIHEDLKSNRKKDVHECKLNNPCENGGVCQNNEGSFMCQCTEGWTGQTCGEDVDECIESPCSHGDCVNQPGSYVCNCKPGWTDKHCKTDVNECLTKPCQNGGSCRNIIGSYKCTCKDPYFGRNCESAMFATSTRKEIGTKNVEIMCDLRNVEEWRIFDVVRNNVPVIRVNPNGRVQSRFNRRKVRAKPNIGGSNAQINVRFTTFQCQDEGHYTCMIDNTQPRDMETIVTLAPQGKPILSKIEELFGENNIDFNCTGRPGYPDGNLEFEIKLSNETEFRPYQFYSAKITNEDKNCYRTQTINATYLFTMEWNQAKIHCLSGDKYDETNVYLIPPTICERVPVNRSVRHPYDKHKYITCKREAPQARFCPGGTCFEERSQQFTFTFNG